MKKLLTLFLLIPFATFAQVGTVNTDSVYFNIKVYGSQTGSFKFDYSTGKFTRSGSQVECFRTLFRVYHEMNERLMLAFDVIRHVDSTGCIKDPAGFINALKEWYR